MFSKYSASIRVSLNSISHKKKIATGKALTFSIPAEWNAAPAALTEFESLIKSIYIFWKEEIATDIQFLTSKTIDTRPRDFGIRIYQIRTTHQHSDNEVANIATRDWCSAVTNESAVEGNEWAQYGSQIFQEFDAALSQLLSTAHSLTLDGASRAQWTAIGKHSIAVIVEYVAADLGLSYPQQQLSHHVRAVKNRADKDGGRRPNDRQKLLEQYAEEQLLSRLGRLPVPYREILNEVGVIGKPTAAPALQLAHSVAALSGLRGDAFRRRFLETWRCAAKT